jgi:hypothetical protein
LDILFTTPTVKIRMTGEAHSLKGSSDEEVFSLKIVELAKTHWWRDDKWPPRILSDEWEA